MTKQSEIKTIKSEKKKSLEKTSASQKTEKDTETASLAKKIKKPIHPISKIKIRENFDSFYSGGEIQLIGEDQRIFSIFEDKIRVYNLSSYKVIAEIEHKNEEIFNFVSFLKNQIRYLITFTRNGMLRLLKLTESTEESSNPKLEFEVLEKKKVLRFLAVEMKIDSSGKYIVLADPKGDFKIINAQTFKVIREFNLGGAYVKMRIVGQYIVLITRERTLVFYNILTNRKVKEVSTDNKATFSDFAVLSTHNKRILLTGFDKVIYYFDTKSEKILPIGETDAFVNLVETITFTEHKKQTLVILGLEDGRVVFNWFDPDLKTLTALNVHCGFKNKHQFQRVLFDFPKSLIYFVTDEGEVFKTRLSHQPNSEIKIELVEEYVGLNDQIMDVKVINSEYAVVCTNSETIRVINLQSRTSKLLSGHEDLVTCVDVFKDKYMVTGAKDGQVYLWKILNKNTSDSENNEKGTLEFNLASDTNFNVNFKLIKKYKAHTGGVTTLKFAPKTGLKFVSSGAEGLIKLWDLKNKTCKSVKPHLKELNFVRISNNEKIIVTGSHDRQINFYNAKDLTLIAQVSAHKRGVWDADFAPIEKIVASASSDMTIKLWNFEDLSKIEQVGTLEGSTAPVLKVKWIVRGLQIISGSADGIIKIWNVKKSVCVSSFDMHQGRIWSLDVLESDDDKLLVLSGDNNNGLMLWEDCTQDDTADKTLIDQENATQQERIRILFANKDFAASVQFAYEKGMQMTFFDAIAKWRNDFLHKTEAIYSADTVVQIANEKNPDEFERLLKDVLCLLYQNDKKRFLLLLKNFVTHSKFSVLVQLVLKILLSVQKMDQLTQTQDELKGDNVDLQQVFEIYKVFTERHFSALKRNLKMAHSFNLFVEKNEEVIN